MTTPEHDIDGTHLPSAANNAGEPALTSPERAQQDWLPGETEQDREIRLGRQQSESEQGQDGAETRDLAAEWREQQDGDTER